MTTAVQLAQSVAPGVSLGFKNRLINPGMVIDQRNAGASGTATGYTVDRWQYSASQASKVTWQQNAGSVTPPPGFSNYLGFTSSSSYSSLSSDYFVLAQRIEGFNTADLAFGTNSALTTTLSFWVRSSLTGTFGGSYENSANNRSYVFSYVINSANTWEYKTVTIPGDTTGTWVGATNGQGLKLWFDLGNGTTYKTTAGSWVSGDYQGVTGGVNLVGTSGATWYITGVQLEVGTAATSFEFRDIGREMILCQRYYQKSFSQGQAPANNVEASRAINAIGGRMQVADVIGMRSGEISLVCYMRTQPTFVTYNPFSATGVAYYYSQTAATQDSTTAGALSSSECGFALFQYTGVTPGTTGDLLQVIYHYTASAEL